MSLMTEKDRNKLRQALTIVKSTGMYQTDVQNGEDRGYIHKICSDLNYLILVAE